MSADIGMARTDRDLGWQGCFNVRDLGGIPVAGGGVIRWGAAVRSDNEIRDILACKNTTARAAMLDALKGLDVEAHLRAAGLHAQDVQAIRERFLGVRA
ncbi:tyrosine-protein phosphatase [Nonomuraea helvata]|uniref:Tyrosine-protein phosphatase n=1 Tax=Nonomuraea helvata TaxID=37484 RepID=A0ABV5S5K7_9ACTN